ncbi:MAG: HAMP domain-containing sensor histidine kinase [Anaeromyxobacter sp.]
MRLGAPVIVPLAAALLGLAGSLGATYGLYRAASGAVDRVLEERLRGAGVTAAELLADTAATGERLRGIMDSNRLDGAYVVSPALEVVADATGPSGVKADLLRVDAERVRAALEGRITMARAYDVGPLAVDTAYFPIRAPDGAVPAVLALEVGQAFAAARTGLRQALAVGVMLACLGAVALGVVAARFAAAERRERDAAARAARGDAMSRMAAVAAHEIRNPLGIIRTAVELVRERAGPGLEPRSREHLEDVLGEVERLRRLTEDFLDLSAERTMALHPIDLAEVVADAARGCLALHPELEVREDLAPLPRVPADARRLRQVLANLLDNAAQAGARRVELSARPGAGAVQLTIRDDGRGVPPELRERLFEAFATGREQGTGLGLAVSRRLVELHGGSLALLPVDGPGAAFRITLPTER